MLVGTALAVIIPEGIDAIYSMNKKSCCLQRQLIKGTQTHNTTFSSGAANAMALHSHSHSHSHNSDMHSLVGIALCIGFIVMLLVDYLSGLAFHNQGNRYIHASKTCAIICYYYILTLI